MKSSDGTHPFEFEAVDAMKRLVRRIAVTVAVLVTVVAALFLAGSVYRRYKFPYGWSHCCDKALMFALQQYAEEHGGAYPAGEPTPDACLSLLYPKYADAVLLSGKTVPLAVAQKRLAHGQLLTPETCGWHYVPGLTLKSNPEIALLWGKVALGHNGERTPDGGQTVVRVDSQLDYIKGSDWASFLEYQQELLAARALKLQLRQKSAPVTQP